LAELEDTGYFTEFFLEVSLEYVQMLLIGIAHLEETFLEGRIQARQGWGYLAYLCPSPSLHLRIILTNIRIYLPQRLQVGGSSFEISFQ